MAKILGKIDISKNYPNYTQNELEMKFPTNQIVLVNSVGLVNHDGKDIAYNRTDCALLDEVKNPTSVVVLTNKTNKNFPDPSKLLKLNDATVTPKYAFKSNGMMYEFQDNIPKRLKKVEHASLKTMLDAVNEKNTKAAKIAIEYYISKENANNMFSK